MVVPFFYLDFERKDGKVNGSSQVATENWKEAMLLLFSPNFEAVTLTLDVLIPSSQAICSHM